MFNDLERPLPPVSTSYRSLTLNISETIRYKGKGKGLVTCYSATYMSQTRDQQRFTISEVAADWHEHIQTQFQWDRDLQMPYSTVSFRMILSELAKYSMMRKVAQSLCDS